MFDDLNLIGTPEKGIELQTMLGNDIANSQAPAPSDHHRRQFEMHCNNHPEWQVRKTPCGTYNCYGHVWASRRTSIYEDDEVNKILKEDGYRPLPSGAAPMCGDLILYFDKESNNLTHIGIVSEIRKLVGIQRGNNALAVPWILSKLNDTLGEVLHRFNDPICPQGSFRFEYWYER